MKITILTLFPEMFKGFLTESILGRAQKNGLLEIETVNLRDWGLGKHKSVDDTPYGGGAGMVLRVDVVAEAINDIKSKVNGPWPEPGTGRQKLKVILMSPQGQIFKQSVTKDLLNANCDLLFVCGHYEGFDERIRDYVDMELSIGDYVLTGGELAAAVITDAVARLIPGVLGKEESHQSESFEDNLLEYPHYTRPEEFEGKTVPEVLKGGHHAEIQKWRIAEATKRTQKRRPDLLK
jgi:tRNA (guanine37-N1)-methyltransferase